MTMHTKNKTFDFLCCLSTFISFYLSYSGITNTNAKCIRSEKEALLQFKHAISFDYCGLLSSWEEHTDCCEWYGIHCSNLSNHVIKLDLSGNNNQYGYCLQGKITSSLTKLKFLTHLDLSQNKFDSVTIPSNLGSLINLEHLNLSNSGFVGKIPHQLGNLSLLNALDLSGNLVYVADSFWWLSNLTLLRDIRFSFIDLSNVSDLFQKLNQLHYLRTLYMDGCQLSEKLTPLSYVNSSANLGVINLANNDFKDGSIFKWLSNFTRITNHIEYLDLSSNKLEGPIPDIFARMESLSYLDVSGNRFEGPISESISNLKNLAHLDLSFNSFKGNPPQAIGTLCSLHFLELSYNNFTTELSNIIQTLSRCVNNELEVLILSNNHIWGSIPDTISTLSSLRKLYLDNNNLNGSISEGIGQLSLLERVHLSSNSLRGHLSNKHLMNLSSLVDLDLSYNPTLVINITSDWIPRFQLDNIQLSFCMLGPHFPNWILTQSNYSWLDLSNSGISSSIPSSFWKSLPSGLVHLNISHNMIHGLLQNVSINFFNFPEIDLSSNKLEGAIPSFGGSISSLLLNDNLFANTSSFLCPRSSVVLSNLDISNNKLYGQFPDCWMNFKTLSILHLENNQLWGKLPSSIGYLDQLGSLHLRNNSLFGELPSSLENCTSLVILDLSYNSFTGHIPRGVVRNLKTLGILNLRNNNLHGSLPTSLCYLSHLQILDLSNNHISGVIPKCISNLTAMKTSKNLLPSIFFQDAENYFSYIDIEWVMWKRQEQSFKNSLGDVKSIDISNNELRGKIPNEITSLYGLVFLNLSRNSLSGKITSDIGNLASLQFLDLSNNQLCGRIPNSLARISYLEMLDLSNNNLSGKIPTGTQLQSFDTAAYSGNPRLCGPPLPSCQVPTNPSNNDDVPENNENGNDDIILGLCISVVLGFIVGFWGVCGTLVLKKSWRFAYFRFVRNYINV